VSNVFGAVIVVVLAHSYSGGTFGGIAALIGLALIATLPATGVQFVVARRAARAELADCVHDLTSLRWSTLLSVALAAVVAAAAPLLAAFLDVPALAVVLVGATIVPYMINSVQLGSLLGHSDLPRLALAQLFLAGSRLAGVIVASSLHEGVTGVLAWLFAATWASVGCGAALTGVRTWTARLPAGADLAGELLTATLTLAGVSVLINLDILLARHFLSSADSGTYALAAMFAKAGLWSAQFVPQLIFAKLARDHDAASALRRAVLAEVAAFLAVLVVAATAARPLLDVVSRDPHVPDAARLAPLFAILGAGWALCYLVLVSAVATRNTAPARMLWLTLVAETALIALDWHHSAAQIVTVCAAGSILVGVAATTLALRTSASPAIPGGVPADAPSAG
jgi:hypothetical protein